LYVDDILLATNDKSFLHEVKQFLSKKIWYEGYGEASYIIGIKIHRDKPWGIFWVYLKKPTRWAKTDPNQNMSIMIITFFNLI
jgi:hypothetical protein